MISFMLLFAACLFAIFLIFIEKKIFGNIFTPYFFLITPFLVICTSNIIAHSFSKFYLVDYRVISFWWIYSFAFFIGGALVFPSIKKRNPTVRTDDKNNLRFVSFVSITASLVLLKIGLDLLHGSVNLHYIASDDFARAYGQGIASHLRIISMIFLIYMIGLVDRKNKLAILAILITIIPFFLYQVKGLFMIPIVSGVIFRAIKGRLNISIKLALKVIAISLVAFYIFYSIPYIYLGMANVVFSNDFISARLISFYSYLSSGILGFSAFIQTDIIIHNEPQRIISPIWNALRHVTGWNRVENIVSEYDFYTTRDQSQVSNVFSIFGTMHSYLGFTLTLVGSMILGFISYFFKMLADNTRNNWFQICHSFNLAVLSFGWFDYYYNYTFIWFFWLFNIMIFLFLKIKRPNLAVNNQAPYA